MLLGDVAGRVGRANDDRAAWRRLEADGELAVVDLGIASGDADGRFLAERAADRHRLSPVGLAGVRVQLDRRRRQVDEEVPLVLGDRARNRPAHLDGDGVVALRERDRAEGRGRPAPVDAPLDGLLAQLLAVDRPLRVLDRGLS